MIYCEEKRDLHWCTVTLTTTSFLSLTEKTKVEPFYLQIVFKHSKIQKKIFSYSVVHLTKFLIFKNTSQYLKVPALNSLSFLTQCLLNDVIYISALIDIRHDLQNDNLKLRFYCGENKSQLPGAFLTAFFLFTAKDDADSWTWTTENSSCWPQQCSLQTAKC